MVPPSLALWMVMVGGERRSTADTFPVFHPHSVFAHSIVSLSYGVLCVCLVILLTVVGLVTFSLRKFRETPDNPEGRLLYGNPPFEVGYTVAFAVILGTISYFSVRAMGISDPQKHLPKDANDVLIVAHQWWWEVHYPKTGVVTANEIHIPTGKSLRFGFRSADVIHDFWVPELGRKMDVIPGLENHSWLAADTPGHYYGSCAEFCGKEHAWMKIRVIAQTPTEFAHWEQEQLKVPPAPTSGIALQGAQFFQEMPCASCHTISGTLAHGVIGPNLTHVASRETLATGRLQNTPADLARWLADPDKVKPGVKMPNLHLTQQQQEAITAYLETLK